MTAQFIKTSFYTAQFLGSSRFSSEKDLRDEIRKKPLIFNYSDVNFTQFQQQNKNIHHGLAVLAARKIVAIPVAFSMGVMTIYHLATALFFGAQAIIKAD